MSAVTGANVTGGRRGLRAQTFTAATVAIVLALLFAAVPLARGKTAFDVQRVGEAHFSVSPTQPLYMLVVGNDNRPGVGGNRGDALHVIGINPALGKATILDIPRDTFVPIPGHGRDRVNAALEYGGPQLEAETVGQLVGVSIPIVVTTNFDGFIAMVDELGGLDMNVPYPMSDSFSGAFFSPGPQHLNGTQALAFSRNRHLGDGDLTRTYDQGLVILAALAKLRADKASPSGAVHDLAVLARHSRLDGIGLLDLYRLGRLGLTLDPANVRNVVMPATLGTVGAADVVFIAPGADSLFADFRDDAVLESH